MNALDTSPLDDLPKLGGEAIYVDIPGLRLAGLAWGPEDGTPVLALHGWLDNAGSFARIAPLLSGVRLVALDLAGHGHSEARHTSASYSFIDWIPDIYYAQEALGWPHCALLGHSLGAAISVCFAGTFPARVDRIALIDGFGPLPGPPETAPPRLQESIEHERRMLRRREAIYKDLDQMAERLEVAIDGLDDAAARTLLVRGVRRRPEDGGLVWTHDPRLRGSSRVRLTEAQIEAFMRRVESPTLTLRAREGWPVDPAMIDMRYDYIPHLEHKVVPGCHHVHLVNPERVAPHLQRFFGASTKT